MFENHLLLTLWLMITFTNVVAVIMLSTRHLISFWVLPAPVNLTAVPSLRYGLIQKLVGFKAELKEKLL